MHNFGSVNRWPGVTAGPHLGGYLNGELELFRGVHPPVVGPGAGNQLRHNRLRQIAGLGDGSDSDQRLRIGGARVRGDPALRQVLNAHTAGASGIGHASKATSLWASCGRKLATFARWLVRASKNISFEHSQWALDSGQRAQIAHAGPFGRDHGGIVLA